MITDKQRQLAEILPGTWDSSIMTLAFDGPGSSNEGKGRVISLANGQAIDFDYVLTENDGVPVLMLKTPALRDMQYEIATWDSHSLSLVKKGYETVTAFVKRRRA